MAKLEGVLWASLLCLATVGGAVGQSTLPKLDPETAKELYGVYAGCRAYWKVVGHCLPSGLSSSDTSRVRQSLDRLREIGVDHMKWLAEKANLSSGMQSQIAATAETRVTSAAVGSCEAAPSLIKEYRDKCAGLYQNVTSAQKEMPRSDPKLALENIDSAAKFIISTCYEPIDDVSRVTSYARIMKWRELNADQKTMLRPVDSTFFAGWEVDHDGMTYLVSVNRGHLKGRPTEVCQVSVPQRAEPIVSRIMGTVKMRSLGTNNSGTQISEMYELISHPSVKTGTMLVGRATDGREFFTIAFMGVK